MADIMYKTFNDVIKLSVCNYFKTTNPFIDTIISTAVLTFIGYFTNKIFFSESRFSLLINLQERIKSFFYKKYSVTFEGRHSFIISKFDVTPNISACFTNSFKALLDDIVNNIDSNDSIMEIKEYITFKRYDSDNLKDMYIITQERNFLYNKELEIYGSVEIVGEETENKKLQNAKTDKIIITLYSHHSNVCVIRDFVEKIKTAYLEKIENSRDNKKFIYSLCKTNFSDCKYECWREYPFESSRSFSNMFFEGKEEIINKIAFFLENKQWYYDNGIPYTLGIGLHGPPGTGKTSFFKCLSNLTGRHIVTLSLKLIKTRQQLDDFFFEDRYHEDNKKGSVGFDKKIIIIEDIDCMGDIVLKRELCGGQVKKTPGRKKKEKTMEDPKIVENIIQQVIENNNEQAQKIMNDCKLPPDEDPITLDDILNLWDGLRETSGRILGITSNHYEKLDPALVRPGRIDITLNFDNATRATIQEMYTHYYGEEMDADELEKIRDRFYSPAEIINCYIIYKDEPEKFTERLMKNISFYAA